MSDLISSLADQIVALNNSSPHLPRKEQIEAVLRGGGAITPTLRADFAPKITMKVDPTTDNLIVTGKAQDVELGYAVTLMALRNGSVFNDIVETHTKLVDSLWKALHCSHPSWSPCRYPNGLTTCDACGRAKP